MSWLGSVQNPFEVTVVPDAWQPPAVDVPSIHHEAFEQCLRALESAARAHPDSLLIYGPAGSGKTHLLSRLQRHLLATSDDAPDRVLHCVFVSVKLQTSAELLWQHVRRRLAQDLLRKQQGVTQLQRLVAHQVAAARRESPRQWVFQLRVLTKLEGESVSEYLAQVAEKLGLERDLFVVLEHLVHNRYAMDAGAWLRGDSLPEAVLERLGLGTQEAEDREDAARQVVKALCRLAGETLPIAFCFDQIEALQTHPNDTKSLFLFGQMAAELSEADANVFLISCIQSAFVEQLHAAIRQSDQDRIFRRRTALLPLDRGQVEQLVVSRLDSIAELLEHQKPDEQRFYPFDQQFIGELASLTPCVPRRVVAQAGARFEQLQRGRAPLPVTPDNYLPQEFEQRQAAALELGKAQDSTTTLLHGLPLLWSTAERGSTAQQTGGQLTLNSRRGSLSVSVCNEQHMNSLAARLRRMLRSADTSAPLVIVRDARLGISRTAKKTREYLDDLSRRGARLVQPNAEALAALEALRSLISDARSGDLAAGGEAIAESTVCKWLRARLMDVKDVPELVDLLDALEGQSSLSEYDQRLLSDLTDIVLRHRIAPLEQLARDLEQEAEQLLEVARNNPDRFGVLHGPPTVLFSFVPAESLSHVQGGGQHD